MSLSFYQLEAAYQQILSKKDAGRELAKEDVRLLLEIARQAWNLDDDNKDQGLSLAGVCMDAIRETNFYKASLRGKKSMKLRDFAPGKTASSGRMLSVPIHDVVANFDEAYAAVYNGAPRARVGSYHSNQTLDRKLRAFVEGPPEDAKAGPDFNIDQRAAAVRDARVYGDNPNYTADTWKRGALDMLVKQGKLSTDDGVSIIGSLQGDKYSGPFSNTFIQLARATPPTGGRTDVASMIHDIRYALSSDQSDMLEADRRYLQEDLMANNLKIPNSKDELVQMMKQHQAGLLLSLKSVSDTIFGPEASYKILGLQQNEGIPPAGRTYLQDVLDFTLRNRDRWDQHSFYLDLQKFMINHQLRPRIVGRAPQGDYDLRFDNTISGDIRTDIQFTDQGGQQVGVTMDVKEDPLPLQIGETVPSLQTLQTGGDVPRLQPPGDAQGDTKVVQIDHFAESQGIQQRPLPTLMVPEEFKQLMVAAGNYLQTQQDQLQRQRDMLYHSFEQNQRLHDQLSSNHQSLIHIGEQERQMVLQSQENLNQFALVLQKREEEFQMVRQGYEQMIIGNFQQNQAALEHVRQIVFAQQAQMQLQFETGVRELIAQQENALKFVLETQARYLEHTVHSLVESQNQHMEAKSNEFLLRLDQNQKNLLDYVGHVIATRDKDADSRLHEVYNQHIATLQRQIDRNHQSQSDLASQITSLSKRVQSEEEGEALRRMVDFTRDLKERDGVLQDRMNHIMESTRDSLHHLSASLTDSINAQNQRINSMANSGLFQGQAHTARVRRTNVGRYVYLDSDDEDMMSDDEVDAKGSVKVRLPRDQHTSRSDRPVLAEGLSAGGKLLRADERDPEKPNMPSFTESLEFLSSDAMTKYDTREYINWRNNSIDWGRYTNFGFSGEPFHKRHARENGSGIEAKHLLPRRTRIQPPGLTLQVPFDYTGKISFEVPQGELLKQIENDPGVDSAVQNRKQSVEPKILAIEPATRPQFKPVVDKTLHHKLSLNATAPDHGVPPWDYEEHRTSDAATLHNVLPDDIFR